MKIEQKTPKSINKMVDLCLEIALKAHGGQHDIDGNPVILHPLTVGLSGETPEEQCAGFLNDLHHNLERGRKIDYQALVEKHEAAIEIFKSIGL